MIKPSDPPRRTPVEIDNPISWEPSIAFLRYTIGALLICASAFSVLVLLVAPDQILVRLPGPLVMCLLAAVGWVLLERGQHRASIHFMAYGVLSLSLIHILTILAPAIPRWRS